MNDEFDRIVEDATHDGIAITYYGDSAGRDHYTIREDGNHLGSYFVGNGRTEDATYSGAHYWKGLVPACVVRDHAQAESDKRELLYLIKPFGL